MNGRLLARVALLCAQAVAYPDLDVNRYVAELNRLAQEAGGFVPNVDAGHVRGLLLAEYLFGRVPFRGNRQEYADPRNSFLNDVLERRLGIPITLSILYLDIARRLEIPAYGVGLPGHFIVGVRGAQEPWYLDPYNGGGRLSLNECVRLVAFTTGYEGPFRSQWLDPTGPHEITIRMLNNLRAIYAQQEKWAEALRVIAQLRLVQPDVPEHLRDLGLIHYRMGSTRLSARYLEAYLQQVPDAGDAHTIREGIASTLDDWARLN
jgi:regulator of sirC expression with transglutaminase-like and TPR domain